MNIQGKLIEIFDTIQITETFKKREFIIQDNKNPEYPEFIKIELIQDLSLNNMCMSNIRLANSKSKFVKNVYNASLTCYGD